MGSDVKLVLRMDTPLERIRRAELDSVRRWFQPGARVLELGGGSGFQAAIMASWGCDIVSLDVPDKPSPERQAFQRQYHPVQAYDGRHLPFGDEEFDVIFSSNMLYHVAPLQDFLAEIWRVLRPGGTALHILPSVQWRFWTNLVHPFSMARIVARRLRRKGSAVVPEEANGSRPPRDSRLRRLWRLVWSGPLGPASSSLDELFQFRSSRWAADFRRAGFEHIEVGSNGLFYTGCILRPDMPLAARRRWAGVLGSACYVITMQRPLTPA
jgi:SAM-dependent methyltransferase